MAGVLSEKSVKAIERGLRHGKCLTVIPDPKTGARVFECSEYLTPEESEVLLQSLAQPTPGTCLERFIWEFENGSTKRFARKVGYHPNRISAIKSGDRHISLRLFRRITDAYQLSEKERRFWAERLVGV
jgi:hypothetical protein